MCLLIAKKESFLWNRYINGGLIIWLLRCTKTFPGLYIIEIYLKKSRNDYQQKCKQPKLLLRASFLHTKNISFFIFIQLNLVPRSFLLEKGKSPGDKVVLILATDHELVNLYTVAKTIIDHRNTSRLGSFLGLYPQRFTSPSGNICKHGQP